jgi:uncharacterized protein YndB with AHSA1/START domain
MVTDINKAITMTRIFPHDVSKVYRAWTDPELVSIWFKPNERWASVESEIEPRVGGPMKIKMTHSDGDVFRNEGVFLEVVPNERLVFTWNWLEDPSDNGETEVTVTIRAVAEGTELTLVHSKVTNEDYANNLSNGWGGALANLETFLVTAA